MKTLPSYYEFYNPVKIISGHKALDNIPNELHQLHVERPLIITDQGVTDAGLTKLIMNTFVDSGMTIGAIYDKTPADSSIKAVNEISKLYTNNSCDSIIAIGGGSVIDTAKGVNIIISEGDDDLSKFMGAEILNTLMKPLIVVPTTAGTGSEVTLVAVINDEDNGIKMPFTSYKLLPDVAILDPRMTLTLPAKLTAATAMDALTHAIEAYICLQHNPMSDAYSTAAIELIRDNLLTAVQDGKNINARFSLANASCMAGTAFSNSMVGIIHSLGHATGAIAHVPHGVAMSIFLPLGLEYNIKSSAELIGNLLLHIGGPEIFASTSPNDRPYKTIECIRTIQKQLNSLCQLPRSLSEAGVFEEQLELIAEAAINDGSLIFNPEEMDKNDALDLLKLAF